MFLLGFLIRADVLIRSVTLDILCVFRRHFAVALLIGCGAVIRWYHAGSWALRLGSRRIAARFVLYFLAVLSILMVS